MDLLMNENDQFIGETRSKSGYINGELTIYIFYVVIRSKLQNLFPLFWCSFFLSHSLCCGLAFSNGYQFRCFLLSCLHWFSTIITLMLSIIICDSNEYWLKSKKSYLFINLILAAYWWACFCVDLHWKSYQFQCSTKYVNKA